jgi:hypothetical protein
VDLGDLGHGFNEHVGANQSRTTGTLHNGVIDEFDGFISLKK